MRKALAASVLLAAASAAWPQSPTAEKPSLGGTPQTSPGSFERPSPFPKDTNPGR